MKLLNALCLLLCVMLLQACANKEPVVVTNEIPVSLLVIEPVIARPDVYTGDDTQDAKNGTAYIYELEDRIELYEDRITCINSIVRKQKCDN